MKIRLRTLALVLVLAASAAGVVVYAGIYNIAATEQHTAPVFHLMDYAMRRSVKVRAEAIPVPDLAYASRLRNGFLQYRAHCQQCHGAPGLAPDPLGMGLTPAPANLVVTVREWRAQDIYWTIRHGIKMTGMPAWQYRMSDEEIWDVVAFVKLLPTMTPRQYEAWSEGMPSGREPLHARTSSPSAARLGDADAGRRAISQYLCATCHRIPGVTGANKQVGPPLDGIGSRKYIAGILPNTPENMIRWLQHPRQIDPLSAMPDLGVNDHDARDIAAYLFTLQELR